MVWNYIGLLVNHIWALIGLTIFIIIALPIFFGGE
jgi:hypothetical protein